MGGWSTRQLADLAGTTLRAVRYYHEVGLLAEPERAANGYKQYEVAHLVRLIRIRRLSELGVPLPRIAAMEDGDDSPRQVLESLDAELARSIERQTRARAELAEVLQQDLPLELPAELAAAAEGLAAPTRALMVVYGRVLDQRGRETLRRFLSGSRRTPVDAELDEVAPDADEATRERVARRLVPRVHALLEEHRALLAAELLPPGRAAQVRHTIALAIAQLYHPAQLDVLVRVDRGLAELARAGPAEGSGPTEP